MFFEEHNTNIEFHLSSFQTGIRGAANVEIAVATAQHVFRIQIVALHFLGKHVLGNFVPEHQFEMVDELRSKQVVFLDCCRSSSSVDFWYILHGR